MKRHSLEDLPKECIFVKQDSFNNGETESFKKPTLKCFSFEEIYVATNGFSSGNPKSFPSIKRVCFHCSLLKNKGTINESCKD